MRSMRTAVSVGSLLIFAGVASAQPPEAPPPPIPPEAYRHPWTLTPLFGTTVGVDISAGAQVEMPGRVRLMATVGWVPNGYAWMQGEAYGSVNNRPRIGDLLQDITKFSWVFSANATWRPMPRRGFFFGAGYALQWATKGGLFAGQIEQGTNEMFPLSETADLSLFESSIKINALTGTVGWEWAIGDGFMVRAAVGVVVPVHTSTDLKPEFIPMNPALVEGFTTAASNALEDAGTWRIFPVGSLHLGYTFY